MAKKNRSAKRQEEIIPPENGASEPSDEARRIPPIIDQDDRSLLARFIGPVVERVKDTLRQLADMLSRFFNRLVYWLKRFILASALVAILLLLAAQFISPQQSYNILHWQNLTQRAAGLLGLEPIDSQGTPAPVETATEMAAETQIEPPTETLVAETPAAPEQTADVEAPSVAAAEMSEILRAERAQHAETRAALAVSRLELEALQAARDAQAALAAEPVDVPVAEPAAEPTAEPAAKTEAVIAAPSPASLAADLVWRLDAGLPFAAALTALPPYLLDATTLDRLRAHENGAPTWALLQQNYAQLRAALATPAAPVSPNAPETAPPAAFTWVQETSRGLVQIKQAAPETPAAPPQAALIAQLDAAMAQGDVAQMRVLLASQAPAPDAALYPAWQGFYQQLDDYLALRPILTRLQQAALSEPRQ